MLKFVASLLAMTELYHFGDTTIKKYSMHRISKVIGCTIEDLIEK